MRISTSPTRVLALAVPLSLAASGCDGNGDLPPDRDPYEGDTVTPLDCVPNLDGQIDAAELLTAYGVSVSYLVSPPGVVRDVDIDGEVRDDTLVWDWSVDYADDQIARLMPEHIEGKWYAEHFPADAFVAPFDAGGSIETISRQDDQGLWLLGLASSQSKPPGGQTLLVYDQPVQILSFPIAPGASLVSTGRLEQATFQGVPYAAVDTYTVDVDAVGQLRLPTYTFTQVHRVRTQLEVAPAIGDPTSVRQVSFFFECFGEVARATSHPDEPSPDFSEAAELRRIGF